MGVIRQPYHTTSDYNTLEPNLPNRGLNKWPKKFTQKQLNLRKVIRDNRNMRTSYNKSQKVWIPQSASSSMQRKRKNSQSAERSELDRLGHKIEFCTSYNEDRQLNININSAKRSSKLKLNGAKNKRKKLKNLATKTLNNLGIISNYGSLIAHEKGT